MIPRYTRPEMGAVWSDQNKFQQWLEVELAASETLAELGVVPATDAELLRKHAGFDAARIDEIEKTTRHDVIAFTTAVAESMAAAGHPDWIAGDWDAYVGLAARLASDPVRLAGWRAGLREELRRSPLLDHAGQAARLGAAFEKMGRACAAGRPAPEPCAV